MAEYIKFRLTAAKVGVSMALMALIAGIADRVGSNPSTVQTRQSAQFLKLSGIGGNTAYNFSKMEKKLLKLQTVLNKVDSTLTHKYLKLSDANSKWLKIADANSEFLKVDSANAQFLKIADANAKFLKLDGTAANANLLAGHQASDFFQGHGNVVSGALPAVQSQGTQQLLALPDGTLSVLIGLLRGSDTQVTIQNNTSQTLSAVQEFSSSSTSTSTPITLKPGNNTLSFIVPAGSAGQLHLQIFPSGQAFSQVVSILVSLDTVNGAQSAIGQAFTGGV